MSRAYASNVCRVSSFDRSEESFATCETCASPTWSRNHSPNEVADVIQKSRVEGRKAGREGGGRGSGREGGREEGRVGLSRSLARVYLEIARLARPERRSSSHVHPSALFSGKVFVRPVGRTAPPGERVRLCAPDPGGLRGGSLRKSFLGRFSSRCACRRDLPLTFVRP